MAAAVVAGSVPASAAPITPGSWTVSPGGAVTGSAGQTVFTIEESGVELLCSSSSAQATLATSYAGSPAPLVTLPAGTVHFEDCSGPFGLTFDVEHIGDWVFNGDTYDSATGVAAGRLTDIEANLVGPGCFATVKGSVGGTYTNGTAKLATLRPSGVSDLLITRVDPANNCFDLIKQGEHGVFDASYSISAAQTIVGNP